jgi:hypothetical protein
MPQWVGHVVEGEACSNNVPPGEDVATPTLPLQGKQPAVVDDEARPQSPSAIPLAAETNTPSGERGSSATKRLKRFTAKILRKVSSPLLPQPDVEAQAKLPTRSKRIAAHVLSRAPASKRGEVLVMK